MRSTECDISERGLGKGIVNVFIFQTSDSNYKHLQGFIIIFLLKKFGKNRIEYENEDETITCITQNNATCDWDIAKKQSY